MIGKTISHYKILKKLGSGGMGVVYKAKDLKLGRFVVLKFLPLHLSADDEEKQRFIQEAKAASALDHPNICTIYEIGETAEGQIFIVIAYYEGETLKKKIECGPLKVNEAIDVAIQVAQGLERAHESGIIHRDIKSANIMITDRGEVKILDFGLAKLVGQTKLTKTSTMMGTIAYMSPEQACGEEVDYRTDIWSLGVVLYEMLIAQLPFIQEYEAAIIYSILNESPPLPREIREDMPAELEKIILKCLRKDRKDRYSSIQQLLKNLKNLDKVLITEKKDALAFEKQRPEIKKETERRQATVMFAEISGYYEMLERLDSEEVASIMNNCYEMFDSIVEKYAGKIDKIMGNNVTILFGVPTAIEEAPKEAVNTAIEMRNQLDQFNQGKNLSIPLDIHIGIDTGTVIAGAVGTDEKRDYTVIGDTVTLASQLKDLSAKGQIYVGSSTYRYTRNEFDYKPLKPITIEGKIKPIRIYELLSTTAKIYQPEFGVERKIFSEMVGRDEELDKLKLHVLKVINGEGSIVSVIGEAGIGKSRLIAELKKVDDLKKVTLLEGRALSIGTNLSYHPIIDILKGWANIKEEDSETESLTKLEHAIANIYPEEIGEIFPFVATLMGIKLTGKHAERIKGIEGEAMEKLIFKNMRELMIKIAERRPVVCIIHDIHWADMSSIELFESLFRLAKKHAILFINVMRPNYPETGEHVLETIRERYSTIHSEIHLEPLDEKQCDVLIRNLIKASEIPTQIRTTIANRAEGNPFFIEEVVRSFVDEGVIEIQDGKFKVTEKIDSVTIPETINEVLMVRIDKLDKDTRSLLKVASVIGRKFFYKILAEVAKTIEEIDDRLDYLKGVQLIKEQVRMEEIEYLFKHALAQETVYNSILLKKRKELHLNVARSIESIFYERLHEFYGMLAFHFSLGEDLDKADEYLIKAGEEALKSSASSEALHYYKEALNIYLKKYGSTADPKKIAMLEKNIALALFNRGHYIEADEYFFKVLSYYGEKFPKHFISTILKFFVGFLSFLVGLYFPKLKRIRIPTQRDNEVINVFWKKDTGLIFLDPRKMFIELFYWLKKLINSDVKKIENGIGILSLSSAAFLNGGISFSLSSKVLEYVKDKVDKNDVKSLLYYKISEVLLYTFSGDWSNVGECDDNLVKRSVRIGELFYASLYILIHGYSKIEQGHFIDSQEIVQKLYEIANTYENNYSWAAYYWCKTQILMKFRKLNEALIISEDGINFTNKTGFIPYMFSLYSFKTRVQIMMGDIKEAEDSLQYLNKIKPEINLAPYILSTFLLSQLIYDLYRLEEMIKNGNISESLGCRKRAYKTAREAIKISRKIAVDIPESYKLMGVYYWLTGKQKKALTWFDKSIRVGEQLGALPELARTYLEVGKRLLEKQSKYRQLSNIQAEGYLEKARVLFREMELEWDLEELSKIKS